MLTGAGYRWTASFGIFLGGLSTLFQASALLPFRYADEHLASGVWFVASLLGIGVSLVSMFLHSDHPDRESPLNHRAVGYVAVALNSWPWVWFAWLWWFISLSPA